MYEVIFYRNQNGKQPVLEYIQELAAGTDKDSRIKLKKIQDYIKILRANGTRAGYPYMKSIGGGIWELRPLRDRILFAGFKGGIFVLLHYFLKKTQKTPGREIEKARRNLADFIKRSG